MGLNILRESHNFHHQVEIILCFSFDTYFNSLKVMPFQNSQEFELLKSVNQLT